MTSHPGGPYFLLKYSRFWRGRFLLSSIIFDYLLYLAAVLTVCLSVVMLGKFDCFFRSMREKYSRANSTKLPADVSSSVFSDCACYCYCCCCIST